MRRLRTLSLGFVMLLASCAGPTQAWACPATMVGPDGQWTATGEIIGSGWHTDLQVPVVILELRDGSRCQIEVSGFDKFNFPRAPHRLYVQGAVVESARAADPCRVAGKLYGGHEEPAWEEERLSPTGCLTVEVGEDLRNLWIHHPGFAGTVTIPIPEAVGWQALDYVWGREVARIGGVSVPVAKMPPAAWQPRYFLIEWSVVVAS